MQTVSRRRGWRELSRLRQTGLVLLVASCASVGLGCRTTTPRRPPCVQQSSDALREIASGQLERGAPAVAEWERDQARACGWIEPEDRREPEARVFREDVSGG